MSDIFDDRLVDYKFVSVSIDGKVFSIGETEVEIKHYETINSICFIVKMPFIHMKLELWFNRDDKRLYYIHLYYANKWFKTCNRKEKVSCSICENLEYNYTPFSIHVSGTFCKYKIPRLSTGPFPFIINISNIKHLVQQSL